MPDAPSPSDLSAALAKIDRSIQQIEETMRDRPDDRRLQMALASLESARTHLLPTSRVERTEAPVPAPANEGP